MANASSQADLYGDTERPDVEDARLDALPIEALVVTGSSPLAFHAPAGDGVTLCGRRFDVSRRRVETMPAASRPCRRCFTDRVAEKYAARDADVHGAVRNE